MTDQILTNVIGQIGHITLNRPERLNALTTEMCEAITDALTTWERQENIAAVVISGAGERAFCAGGDVVMLHDSGKKDGKDAEAFWRTEYALNELIHRYGKPYISLIDGIVMGGGVGLSVHGRYRVAGDMTMFAMPETGIGYFPDVGGTYFLPRLGLPIGVWLGLTGARLKTPHVCELGIATHYVPSDKHEDLLEALGAADLADGNAAVLEILDKFAQSAPDGEDLPSEIGLFNSDSLDDILSSLETIGTDWALEQHKSISAKSPLACVVTLEALRRGSSMTFQEAMSMELDVSLNFLKTQDFYEGIRSQLIDKDRNPKWSHESVKAVKPAQVERLFKSVAKPSLEFHR